MALKDIDIARRAFSTPEWGGAAEAIFTATGITVSVIDFASGELLAGGKPCAYCYLATGSSTAHPDSCLDDAPAPGSASGRIICRAGLPALYAPVTYGEQVVAHVMVSGFVTSTRERRGRYEHLLARGVAEESARRGIKTIPVIARGQAEAYLGLASASASTLFAATRERMAAAERVEELKLFVSTGHQVVSASLMDEETMSNLTTEAVLLAGAAAGALLKPHGASLEVIARSEAWRGATGTMVPRASTAAGKALDSRRVVVSGVRQDGYVTLALPLLLPERAVGVFELRLAADAVPLNNERLTRLARFAQFVAIALERESERVAVQRAMVGYSQLNSLASALGGQTDTEGVSRLLVREVDKSFEFAVAGVVLNGWGSDRADVIVEDAVSSADIDHLLGVVTGRDLEAAPFEQLRVVAGTGVVAASGPLHEWALSAVELGYGELDVGWLFVARCDGENYSAQDRALLEGFSAHGGPAFGRAALFSRVRDDYAATIEALSATLGGAERATRDHAGKVMHYAVKIGEELGLGVEAVERLRFAGILHDTGKAGIPGEITLRPTKLTPQELLTAHSRAEIQPSIIDQIDFLDSLTPIILHHHENWDGSGYPHGLAGEEIPELARILRVADAYDEMTAARMGDKKLTLAASRKQLRAAAGVHLDPRAVAALLAVLDGQVAAAATGIMASDGSQARPDLLA